MKIFKRKETIYKFHLSSSVLDGTNLMHRTITTRLSLCQTIVKLLKSPLSFFRRSERPSVYIEIIRALNYLFEKKAYLSPVFLFTETPEMVKEFDTRGHASLEARTMDEVFGYARALIMKKTSRLVEKRFESFLSMPEDASNLPQVFQEFVSNPTLYKEYIIQGLLQMMLKLYENAEYNQVKVMSLIYAFAPMFFGKQSLSHLQTKNPVRLEKATKFWKRFLRYLPKGRGVNVQTLQVHS
ncbi:hypothetical protein NECID01_1783 [Nematocida sp. AWRm77]|nr:hypothetical protein NECID01_1783 [Nematocida sp. AWRm77]